MPNLRPSIHVKTKMSMRKTIASLEKQIADSERHCRERYERIFATFPHNKAEREAAIERDRAEYKSLQNRLLECLQSEIDFLKKQNATLQIRREMRGAGVLTPQQALKQRLAAKLAERNTCRAVC